MTILATLTILLTSISPLLALAQPPPIPMTVDGYVSVQLVDGTVVACPSGYNVSARCLGVIYASDLTDENGYYILSISGPTEGASVSLFVQEINVAVITMHYYGVETLNLTVVDTTGPTAPAEVTVTSPPNDPTPSFEWTAANDDFDVVGYYAEITNYPTYWVGDALSWESPDILPDGNYVFSVWARDLAGNNGTAASLEFTIQTLPRPIPNFYANITSGDEPLTVQFYDNSTNFQTVTSWFWDFGDGTNSTEQNPVHTYLQDGVYTVTLNVTGTDLAGNPAEASATKANYITVLDTMPIADFYAEPRSGPAPLNVTFYPNVTSYDEIVSYLWWFGEGSTSTEPNPTFTYADPGTYTVRLTVRDIDGDIAWTEKTRYITVYPAPLNITIYTRFTQYIQGDTISFYINSSRPVDLLLFIQDPEGTPWFYLLLPTPEHGGGWVQVDGWFIVPYQAQKMFGPVTLPNDAPTGTWNWTAYDFTVPEAPQPIVNGTFTVVDRLTIDMVLDRINELDAKLTGLVTNVNGTLYALITTSKGEVLAKLTDLNATITSLITNVKGEVLAKINTALGTVTAKLDDLDAKITAINGTVVTISTAVGDIQTSVDDIGLKVVAINGTVARIETALGTIQGKITSIDGNVATIKTDVGTVKMDISALKSSVDDVKDTVETVPGAVSGLIAPIWAAVILSLIAAIAAIYSVVTIHRKIAG